MKLFISRLAGIVFFTITAVCFANAQGRSATVISPNANLRETPSTSGQIKEEVPIGTDIRVLDSKGAWYVVRIVDAVGWMHGNTFRFTSPSISEQLKSTPGDSTDPSSRSTRVRANSMPSGASSSTSGRSYIRGPRGGCYYYSGSGRKVYVDRSLCN